MEQLNTNPGETSHNFTTATTMEDIGIGHSDNFLTFLDDNSSVVFKGVIDPNGTFLIDPSQLVNILLDRSQTHPQNFVETANGMVRIANSYCQTTQNSFTLLT